MTKIKTRFDNDTQIDECNDVGIIMASTAQFFQLASLCWMTVMVLSKHINQHTIISKTLISPICKVGHLSMTSYH